MDRLGFAVYRTLGFAMGLLPIGVVFCLGAALGWLGYFLAPPYRRLVLRNLGIAFGRERTPRELRALARRHFATLGANLFSSLKLARMSREAIARRVTVEGLETLHAGVEEGRGFVIPTSHLGNWEVWAQVSPVAFPCQAGAIFQALGNPLIDAEVRRDRARQGLRLFERKEGFVKASQSLREGCAVGVLMDQHAGDAGLWCPLFGRLASTTTLPATLALRTGAWLVPAAVYTAGVARWRCVIEPAIPTDGADAGTITARLNECLEAQIRRQPWDAFWVHNRWKTPKPKFLLATYKRGVVEAVASHQSPITNHQSPPPLAPFRIVIRATNWLGDAVMSVPAVRAIKRGRPDAHVTILTPAKLADFWKRVPEVDDVLAIDAEDGVFGVARKLRRGGFEAAILFPNSLRSALEAWLAGIPRRVAYPGHRRRWLLDQPFVEKKKKLSAPPRHQVHHYLALAKFIGADITEAHAPHSASLGTRHSAPGTPVLGICPGAEYGPAKQWLRGRFAQVMKGAHERTGCHCKLFGVAKDREIGDTILAAAEGVPITDLIGKTTLAELMDHLQTCDVLLTNDTGTMHLAACLGVPTVALFGSTEPALTGPLSFGGRVAHHVIRHHVECSPCFLRDCPRDFRCMQAITAEEVLAAVEPRLRRAGTWNS